MSQEQPSIEKMAERYIQAFQPATEMIHRVFAIYGEAGEKMIQSFAKALQGDTPEKETNDNPPVQG